MLYVDGKRAYNPNTWITLPMDMVVEAVSSSELLVANMEDTTFALKRDGKNELNRLKSTRFCSCQSLGLKISELVYYKWTSVFLDNSYPFLTSLTLNCEVFAFRFHSRQQGVDRVDQQCLDVRQLPISPEDCSEQFIMPLLLTRSRHAARDPPEHAQVLFDQPGS